jgi:hypothetical protein
MQDSLTIYVKCHPPSGKAYQVSSRRHVFIGEYTTRDAVRDFGVSYFFGSGAIKEIPDEGKAAS